MKESSRIKSHVHDSMTRNPAERAPISRVLRNRAACSPRASIALSALATFDWLREKVGHIPSVLKSGARRSVELNGK